MIEAANQTEGVTADTFLKEVDKMNVVPFAAKPVTLKMLLKLYASKQGFPKTQREIYEAGCRLLCAEPSKTRREKGFVGNYAPDQYMAVAARMAAVTAFGRRSAIFTEFDPTDANDEDVTLRKLCGGVEAANGDEFKVSETAILETGFAQKVGMKRNILSLLSTRFHN